MRLAAGGICLYVISSGGSSVKEISWAISARVLVLKDPVLLMTIGKFAPYYTPPSDGRNYCIPSAGRDLLDLHEDRMKHRHSAGRSTRQAKAC